MPPSPPRTITRPIPRVLVSGYRGSDNAGINVLMAARQQDAVLLPREYNPRNAALPGGGGVSASGKPRFFSSPRHAYLPVHARPGITLFTGAALSRGISRRVLNNEDDCDAARPSARALRVKAITGNSIIV